MPGWIRHVIEADLKASDLVESIRQEAKRLPSRFVAQADVTEDADAMQRSWDELAAQIELIESSDAGSVVEPEVMGAVTRSFASANREYEDTRTIAKAGSADLETLLERAIVIDKALRSLATALGVLAVDLRAELQSAVDAERKVQNRPIQAAVIIGTVSVLLLAAFTWCTSGKILFHNSKTWPYGIEFDDIY